MSLKKIQKSSGFDPWFLDQIEMIVKFEEGLREKGLPSNKSDFLTVKKLGFSDARIGELVNLNANAVTLKRKELGVNPIYKRVDTCAAEFSSQTSYMYSSYEGDGLNEPENEVNPSLAKKVIILGGGPNRIGQGIEFDYCCVHAAYAMKEAGYESIMAVSYTHLRAHET